MRAMTQRAINYPSDHCARTLSIRAPFDAATQRCYDRNAGWSSLVARWAHNPKVGGSNPPPATNFINHLARFTDFHLGQIRVTNSLYCTEVVFVGQSAHRSFSGF